MTKKLKIFALLTGMMFGGTGIAQAQNGFNVPFSQFGIGTTELPFGLPMAARMGGVVYSRSSSNSINPFNPASYAAVEMESFVLDVGVNIQNSVLRNDLNKQTDADGNLAYLTVAFPLTKWWKTSMGLLPYSSVNYESVQTAFDALTLSNVKTIYSGNGGVAQLYWGNGFNIGKRLSLGFNINYLYGTIQRAIGYKFMGNDSTYCMNSRRQKDTYVSNMVLDFGLQYHQPLTEKYTLHLGLTARTPREMTVAEKALVYTYHTSASIEYLFDTIFPHDGQSDTYNSTLTQPLQLGMGLSLERNNRWAVAMDGYYSAYSGMQYEECADLEYQIFGTSALTYVNNYRMAAGFEWKGNPAATRYWGRIGLSAGLNYNSGRLAVMVDGDPFQFDEYGMGMGITLPMRKGKSAITLSLSYSSFGSLELLRRDVLTFGLSIGSCEHWFQKKKYN